MKQVWKYTVGADDDSALIPASFQHQIPEGSTFLSLVRDGAGWPCLYFLVDPGAEKTPHLFHIVGTGRDVPPAATHYLGTFHQRPFVWHVLAEKSD